MREIRIMNKPPTPTPPLHPDAWHSPVPYLFGGLAAMFGLIACALLILACSYWRLSRLLDGENNSSSNSNDGASFHDVETKKGEGNVKSPPCFCEGYVVIMPGEHKATYLATPVSAKANDHSDGVGKVTAEGEKAENGSAVSVLGGD